LLSIDLQVRALRFFVARVSCPEQGEGLDAGLFRASAINPSSQEMSCNNGSNARAPKQHALHLAGNRFGGGGVQPAICI
jgi:hypothetical protein